jgi:hypothetical protein
MVRVFVNRPAKQFRLSRIPWLNHLRFPNISDLLGRVGLWGRVASEQVRSPRSAAIRIAPGGGTGLSIRVRIVVQDESSFREFAVVGRGG